MWWLFPFLLQTSEPHFQLIGTHPNRSIKVKDSRTWKRSIAHFYRDCEVWPRLDHSMILAPSTRPIQASTTRSPTMLAKNKIKLMATLHRATWIAGQRCYVKVCMINGSKKRIRGLTLTLVRTTTTFRPRRLPAAGGKGPLIAGMDIDNEGGGDGERDSFRVRSQITKEVAESVLGMGQNGSKGHASAKGWWTGVAPGQELELSHFILIPVSLALFFSSLPLSHCLLYIYNENPCLSYSRIPCAIIALVTSTTR